MHSTSERNPRVGLDLVFVFGCKPRRVKVVGLVPEVGIAHTRRRRNIDNVALGDDRALKGGSLLDFAGQLEKGWMQSQGFRQDLIKNFHLLHLILRQSAWLGGKGTMLVLGKELSLFFQNSLHPLGLFQ